jgi:hypothetical protein
MKTKLLKEIEDGSAKFEGLLKNFKSKGTSALKELSENELKALINWSKEVIRQYTNLIDNDLSNIKDIADLPYPKERIKLAIKMMLPRLACLLPAVNVLFPVSTFVFKLLGSG